MKTGRQVLGAVVAALVGLGFLALGLAAFGYGAGAALGALGRGAFGSSYAITSATLVRAVPLVVIGLGLSVAFRAGALNIGAEGQFYAGAMAATWVGLQLGSWPAPIAAVVVLAAGAGAGVAWMAVPVVLKLRFGVLEVISTLLLNFVAEGLVSFAVQGPLQESRGTYPQSDPLPESARIPVFPGTRLHWGIVVAVGLGVGLWVVFTRTRWGLRLRAAGEAPRAAAVAGRVRVGRTVAVGLLISAAFGGLAGAFEVAGVTYSLYQNLSPGYGFTAIAVALIARLHPIGVIVAGIGFGALDAGASAMQREANVPAVAVAVVQAVIILVAVLGISRSRLARAEAAT
jgi:simple sugar transport system permease protein